MDYFDFIFILVQKNQDPALVWGEIFSDSFIAVIVGQCDLSIARFLLALPWVFFCILYTWTLLPWLSETESVKWNDGG